MKRCVAISVLAACSAFGARAGLSPDVPAVSVGINEFTFDLYNRLGADAAGNFFCSPFSVSTALAMTYAGARGQTEAQMAAALHYTPAQKHLHPAFRDLARQVNDLGTSGNVELNIANRLWIQDGYATLPAYDDVVRACYGAGFARTAFARDPEAARLEINRWVEEQTRDRIRDLLAPGVVDASTRMVLVNAIYFKGLWADQFKPDQTQDDVFYRAPKDEVTAPMMFRAGKYNYVADARVEVLELPYRGRDVSMFVILPKEAEPLRDVEKLLTAELVERWAGDLSEREVRVWLPRFRVEAGFELVKTLGAMGMTDAFSGAADFSGITGKKDLVIGAIVHKAFVQVNEEGSEAAAATAVVMRPASAMPADRPVEFRANRPFVFLIRDNRTKTILFIGRLADPAAVE